MSKKDPLAYQLEQLIAQVVEQMQAAEVGRINPNLVADCLTLKRDAVDVSPELKTYASTMQLRSIVRQFLARKLDPIKRAEEYVESGTGDLFGGILQGYYPVKHTDDSGERIALYTRRDLLKDADVLAICNRMRKAGDSLIEHADALMAWNKGRNQEDLA